MCQRSVSNVTEEVTWGQIIEDLETRLRNFNFILWVILNLWLGHYKKESNALGYLKQEDCSDIFH